MRVAFIDAQVIMWPRGKTIDDAIVIGEHCNHMDRIVLSGRQDEEPGYLL